MNEAIKVTKYTGLQRIFRAFGNSFSGLVWMFKHESAFRQEVILLFIAIPLVLWLEVSMLSKVVLLCAILQILVVETLNTGIEAVVDRVGLEYHELSGLAKDCGSAAVLISITIAVLIWGAVLAKTYFF